MSSQLLLLLCGLCCLLALISGKRNPPPFEELSLNFDRIERENDVACYYYKIEGLTPNKWDKTVLYMEPHQEVDVTYSAITDVLYQQSEIGPDIFEYEVVISDRFGAGISIAKKRHQNHDVYDNNEIFFCIDDVIDNEHRNGSYCIHLKPETNHKKHKTHPNAPECGFDLLIPDFNAQITTETSSQPTIEPTSQPTTQPTNNPTKDPTAQPTVDLEGEVLVPGENYSFPGGTFTLADNAVVIRPFMIYDCSSDSEYVYLYSDQLGDFSVEIGNPLFSLVIDIYEMPSLCPVLFGTIESITEVDINIVRIDLGDLALPHLFTHADFNVSDMPVIDIGYSIFPNDTFNETDENTDVFTVNNGSYFINDTDLFNDSTLLSASNRRRLWGFDISPQIVFPSWAVTIPVGSYLNDHVKITIQLKYETRFKLHIILDISRAHWYSLPSLNRFKLEWSRTTEASITITAALEASIEKEWTLFEVEGKTFVVSIYGIPVLITPFVRYKYGVSAAVQLKSECKLSVSLTNSRGFDYTRGRGLKLIFIWQPSVDASCDLWEGRQCELSLRMWLTVSRGIKIYKGIISAALESRYGPQLAFIYPTDACSCSSKSAEISLSWVKEKFGSITLYDNKLFKKLLGIEPKTWKTPSVTSTETLHTGICIGLPDLLEDLIHLICCPPPTPSPTKNPTLPSKNPTSNPSMNPTPDPTKSPTPGPTMDPTPDPTREPTDDPTIEDAFSGHASHLFNIEHQVNEVIDDEKGNYVWIVFVIGVISISIVGCIIMIIMFKCNKYVFTKKTQYDTVSDNSESYL